jgi:hypothetical protein
MRERRFRSATSADALLGTSNCLSTLFASASQHGSIEDVRGNGKQA